MFVFSIWFFISCDFIRSKFSVDVICTTDPTASGILTRDLPYRIPSSNVLLPNNTFSSQRSTMPSKRLKDRLRVEIIEEPAPTKLRFRYECEGRLAGSILGVSSTNELKTHPTIQLVGDSTGLRAKVIVSCVSAEYPHRWDFTVTLTLIARSIKQMVWNCFFII